MGKDIVNHVIDAVYYLSKSFCPGDPLGLVQTVFRHHGVADKNTSNQEDFVQWAGSRVVKLLHREYKSAKKSIRRKQILSWIAATTVKRVWIKRLFGVSYEVIRTAQRHTLMWSLGGSVIRLSLQKKKYKPSLKAAYVKRWLKAN